MCGWNGVLSGVLAACVVVVAVHVVVSRAVCGPVGVSCVWYAPWCKVSNSANIFTVRDSNSANVFRVRDPFRSKGFSQICVCNVQRAACSVNSCNGRHIA
jgi:hypothetical protein